MIFEDIIVKLNIDFENNEEYHFIKKHVFQNRTVGRDLMIKLLLIADDFTGALDTGIQFAKYGAATRILTSSEIDDDLWRNDLTEVLVIDTETRHLSRQEAYRKIYCLVTKAIEMGVPHIYKKTDSGLRGNIGSELQAVIDASEERFLPFLPALPAMNRVTVGGIHYVDGVPIRETEFGRDPFDPVISSYVPDLFQEEKTPAVLFERSSHYDTDCSEAVIGIFDASTREDIYHIAEHLKRKDQLRIMAGCAGFASVLPSFLKLKKHQITFPSLSHPLLVACGSINPISKRQIAYGESLGYIRVAMTPRQQLEEEYLSTEEGQSWLQNFPAYFQKSNVVMLDTEASEPCSVEDYRKQHHISLEEARVRIADRIGVILRRLMEKNRDWTLMIIGGDTLMSFINQTQCREIEPVCEIEPGTVISSMKIRDRNTWVITKSGGFGNEKLLQIVADKIGGDAIGF